MTTRHGGACHDESVTDQAVELVRLRPIQGLRRRLSDAAVRRYARDAGPLLGRLKRSWSDCTTRNRAKAEALQESIDDLERRIAEEEDRRMPSGPRSMAMPRPTSVSVRVRSGRSCVGCSSSSAARVSFPRLNFSLVSRRTTLNSSAEPVPLADSLTAMHGGIVGATGQVGGGCALLAERSFP